MNQKILQQRQAILTEMEGIERMEMGALPRNTGRAVQKAKRCATAHITNTNNGRQGAIKAVEFRFRMLLRCARLLKDGSVLNNSLASLWN